jgi:hypothetical protein
MSDKLIITSTNPNMTPEEIEEELVKAVNSKQLAMDKRDFKEVFMKRRKARVAKAVDLVFQSMINEIERVIKSE